MKQILYLLILLQFVLNITWINSYIPFCPKEYISYIASEQYCNCYIWNILVDGGVILFTLGLLFMWEKHYKKHYPVVLYFFIALLGLVVIGVSLSAINGLVGAVGSDTIEISSLWVVGVVLLVCSFLYFFLVLKVSRAYKSVVVAVLLYIFSIGLIVNKFLYIINLMGE